MADDSERVPPQDIEAEQAVLGSMLLDREAVADAVELLTAGDFYRPGHTLAFQLMLDLYTDGQPVDPFTVKALADERRLTTKIGTAAYLHTLIATVPTAANTAYHAQIVRDKALLRRLVKAGTTITQIGYNADDRAADIEGEDADEALNRAMATLGEVAQRRSASDVVQVGDIVSEAMVEMETISAREGTGVIGVPTGFIELDRLMHGLHPGQLVIVAGRPGMGKSTVALDFLRSATLRSGIPSVLFSLEMARNEIVMRMISAEAKVALHQIRGGTMGEREWEKVSGRLPDIMEAPLWIDDSAMTTPIEMRTKCRRLFSTVNIGMVVVDYLQLMTSGKRVENRQQEVSDITRSLKLLAKELGLPVVALAQLNRNSEQRGDKRPVLSDLRESGAVEQDADVVILLHREDAYDKESPRVGEADLIVAKHRNGPTATVAVSSQLHYSRFMDMAGTHQEAPAVPSEDWATRAAGDHHEAAQA